MSQRCLAAVSVAASKHGQNRVLTSHVGKLLAAALEIVAVLGLDGVLDGAGHGVVGTENGALYELDLTGHATLEATGSSDGTTGLLTLSPGLGGAGLAPLVWGGCAVGGAEVSSRFVAACGRVDIGAAMGLAGVLCRAVGRVRLCQAVGRMRAVLRVAVEGVLLGAGRVLVQQRAADLVLIVPAGSVLQQPLASTFTCTFWYRVCLVDRCTGAATHFGVMGVPIVLLVVRHDVQRSRGWHYKWRGSSGREGVRVVRMSANGKRRKERTAGVIKGRNVWHSFQFSSARHERQRLVPTRPSA
jgi:hypothetical protein